MSSEKDGLDDLDLDRADFDHDAASGGKAPASRDDREPSETDSREARSPAPTPHTANKLACQACQSPIEHEYFTTGEHRLCSRCGQALAQQLSRGPEGAFPRALGFGFGGGVLGAALYYAVAAISGYELGIIAIVVGILVGKGVRKGAGLHQHWVYPALGIALTYLAIVSTYVPQVLEAFATNSGTLTEGVYSVDSSSGGTSGARVVLAFLFSLVVPFVMLAQFEIWGPIILAVGLWEGWRYARGARLEVSGPFQNENRRLESEP